MEHKPRGKRRRGKEVLRLDASVKTNKIGESLRKTMVLSDSGDIYEYKKLTKRVCGAFFDWSANWHCIGNKGPISISQWEEKMKANGWRKPIQEEKHLRHIGMPIMDENRRIRQHVKAENARIGSKPNPELGKVLPTRILDFLKLGESKSLKSAFNKLDKEIGNES